MHSLTAENYEKGIKITEAQILEKIPFILNGIIGFCLMRHSLRCKCYF